jgi:hypothetical protein
VRNGRPFLNWELPAPIRKVWEHLRRYPDWEHQVSAILSAIPVYGLEAVGVACEMSLEEKAVSQSVIMNYLARLTEEPKAEDVAVSDRLKLMEEPTADCTVYNRLLGERPCCVKAS